MRVARSPGASGVQGVRPRPSTAGGGAMGDAAPSTVRLTIALPTYARPAEIVRAVTALLPQCGPNDDVLIFDNASPDRVADLVAPVLSAYPDVAVRVHRNVVNIGGNANILRLLEEAHGDFVWLLGDDDHIAPDAIRNIRSAIADAPTAVYWNFCTDTWSRPIRAEACGVKEFLARLDDWANVLFMSAGVYRADAVRPFVRYGYHFSYSMAPHVAMLLLALEGGGTAVFESRAVVTWHAPAQWSPLNAYLGFPTLLDLPLPADAIRTLRVRLRDGVPLPRVLGYLLRYVDGGLPPAEARTIWGLMRLRLFAPSCTWRHRLWLGAGRLLLAVPRISLAVVGPALKVARSLRGRGPALEDFIAHGRYARN